MQMCRYEGMWCACTCSLYYLSLSLSFFLAALMLKLVAQVRGMVCRIAAHSGEELLALLAWPAECQSIPLRRPRPGSLSCLQLPV